MIEIRREALPFLRRNEVVVGEDGGAVEGELALEEAVRGQPGEKEHRKKERA